MKIAVIVDAQYDFMIEADGALAVTGAEALIPTLDEYLASLTLENGYFAALFTADTHDPESYPESEEAKMFPPHCYMGTDGFNFAVDPSKVLPTTEGGIDRFILNKEVFNMWEKEPMIRPFKVAGEPVALGGEQSREEFFDNAMSAGVYDVEVSGVASDYCVKDAIRGLLAREFTVTVYDNLVAGIERDIHQVAKEEFSRALASGELIII